MASKPSWTVPVVVNFLPQFVEAKHRRAYGARLPVGSVPSRDYNTDYPWIEHVEPFEFDATLTYIHREYGRSGIIGIHVEDDSGARFYMNISQFLDICSLKGCGPKMKMSGRWSFYKQGNSISLFLV